MLPILHSLFVSTVNVLTVAAELGGCRILLVGSLTEPRPDETGQTIPSSPYAAAKWASSAYGRMFNRLYGTPVVILRVFMTYGPSQDPKKLIPYVTTSLLRGEGPNLSSGEWSADWIYVDDVVAGMVAAAVAPNIEGSTLDLGSGRLITIRSLVETLAELIDGPAQPSFGALPDRPFEPVCVADIAAARSSLGWRPVVDLRRGLALTVDSYRAELERGRR